MISFRCWFCNKAYAVKESRVGERIRCSCGRPLRVPKRTGGNSRARTPSDWLIEGLVYGGGGAFLGFGLSLLLLMPVRGMATLVQFWLLVPTLTLLGFLVGLFGGEPAINWIGRIIRDREEKNR
jgi:hypothetical protein